MDLKLIYHHPSLPIFFGERDIFSYYEIKEENLIVLFEKVNQSLIHSSNEICLFGLHTEDTIKLVFKNCLEKLKTTKGIIGINICSDIFSLSDKKTVIIKEQFKKFVSSLIILSKIIIINENKSTYKDEQALFLTETIVDKLKETLCPPSKKVYENFNNPLWTHFAKNLLFLNQNKINQNSSKNDITSNKEKDDSETSEESEISEDSESENSYQSKNEKDEKEKSKLDDSESSEVSESENRDKLKADKKKSIKDSHKGYYKIFSSTNGITTTNGMSESLKKTLAGVFNQLGLPNGTYAASVDQYSDNDDSTTEKSTESSVSNSESEGESDSDYNSDNSKENKANDSKQTDKLEKNIIKSNSFKQNEINVNSHLASRKDSSLLKENITKSLSTEKTIKSDKDSFSIATNDFKKKDQTNISNIGLKDNNPKPAKSKITNPLNKNIKDIKTKDNKIENEEIVSDGKNKNAKKSIVAKNPKVALNKDKVKILQTEDNSLSEKKNEETNSSKISVSKEAPKMHKLSQKGKLKEKTPEQNKKIPNEKLKETIPEKNETSQKEKLKEKNIELLEEKMDTKTFKLQILDNEYNLKKDWEPFFTKNANLVKGIFIELEKEESTIFPLKENIFKIFELLNPKEIKVLLLGQDPYVSEGQAMGLSFSVPNGIPPPPSLKNIFIEVENSGFTIKNKSNGNLISWCDQGVFLLNTALTVKKGDSNSHSKLWQEFTSKLMIYLNKECKGMVLLLLGKPAQSYSSYFLDNHKKVFTSHPSPNGAHYGFIGSKVFKLCNDHLITMKKEPINWSI